MSLQTDAGTERAAFRYDRTGDRIQLVANGSGLLVTGAATFSSSVGVGGTSAGNFSGVSFTGPFFDVAGIMQIKGTSANTIAALQFGGDTYRKALIYSSVGTDTPYLAFAVAASGSSSTASEAMRIYIWWVTNDQVE